MGARKRDQEEPEPSRAAGTCVLVVAAGGVTGAVFAASPTAGVLGFWVVGGVLLWRSVRYRVSDMPATPPPGEDRPSCGECAGHELVSVTPLETQKGLTIYKTTDPEHPNHTHIHVSADRET